MTPVCTCARPQVRDSKRGSGKYCSRCGNWWAPEHGSIDPDAPRIVESPIAKVLPPPMKLNRGRTGGGRRKRA